MEGLPVRQWRLRPTIVNTAPPKDSITNLGKEENIWKDMGPPRGSELYPQHSQELLRKARSLQLPSNKPSDDDRDGAEDEDVHGEPDDLLVVNRWVRLPKEEEEPEVEYLAKRRKGLPTLYGGGLGADVQVASSRKIKVKKTDENGNTYFLDVLAPEGATIDGEIQEGEDIVTRAPAPGTVIEGVGIANADGVIVAGGDNLSTPLKRKPPPPKRKPKGPGRGRKKKVIVDNGTGNAPVAVDATGTATGARGVVAPGEARGIRDENGAGEDTHMHGADEGSEEDDEEGEEGDEGDREEGELSDGDGDEQPSRSVTPSKLASNDKNKQPTTPIAKGNTLQIPQVGMANQSQPQEDAMDIDTPTTIPQPSTVNDIQHPEPIHYSSTQDLVANKPDIKSAEPSSEVSAHIESITSEGGDPHGTHDSMATPGAEMKGSDISIVPDTQSASLEVNSPTSKADQSLFTQPSASLSSPQGLDPSQETNLSDSTHAFSIQAPAVPELVTIADSSKDLGSVVQAELPEQHNPLEGLVEPASNDMSTSEATEDQNQQLSSNTQATETKATKDQAGEQAAGGEDDIFGSLERHLDSKTG